MLNDYYSPINNMPNNGYGIQPNPIGNILNIGQQGYNGGYYNNTYNNYYNPYLAIKNHELMQTQLREEQRVQSSMMMMISKAVNKAAGQEMPNERLEELYGYKDPERYVPKPDSMEYEQNLIVGMYLNESNYLPQDIQYINYFNSMYDTAKQECPDNISMYDYNQKMSEKYVKMLVDIDKEKQKDVSKLYNNKDYNKLLDMNSNGSSYFNSIFNGANGNSNVSIDDMEVTLPAHLSNEYQSRRKQFLDAILNKK